MWLKDRVDGTAYFPEENGHFNLEAIHPYGTLEVEGPEILREGNMRSGSSSVDCLQPRSSAVLTPAFKSVVASKKSANHSVKV